MKKSLVISFSYLRVENTRLTDDVERIRLENAHLSERNNTLEQTYTNDQQAIDELKSKNQSLQTLEERFNSDQQQINDLQGKYLVIKQEKDLIEQDKHTLQTNIEQLKQEKQLLNNQVKQSEDKARANEEQVTVKTAEM